jgi:hypothetical protein
VIAGGYSHFTVRVSPGTIVQPVLQVRDFAKTLPWQISSLLPSVELPS